MFPEIIFVCAFMYSVVWYFAFEICVNYHMDVEKKDFKQSVYEAFFRGFFWPISVVKFVIYYVYWVLRGILWGLFTVLFDWKF